MTTPTPPLQPRQPLWAAEPGPYEATAYETAHQPVHEQAYETAYSQPVHRHDGSQEAYTGVDLAEMPFAYLPYEPESPGPGYEVPSAPESAWSVDTRRGRMISRTLLLIILAVQAMLSLRLHSTAFEDEALYIASGHYELANLLHGTPLPVDFAGYFSGSPKLYPVLAAAVDTQFGLAGVRLVSLTFMLASTALLYAMTHRMFNTRAALGAAALFSAIQSTAFLGNFATYDAAAVFLLACSAWAVVRTGRMHPLAVLLAAPPAALAFGVKYASGLYLPTLVAMAVLTAYRYRGWKGLMRGVILGTGIAAMLGLGLYLSGPLGGITGTTTNRAHGTTSAMTILQESWNWGGLMFAAALCGSLDYVRRARMGETPWVAGDIPGHFRRAALGFVLTGTALLAPAYQIHLHTDTSLFKHVGFGLLFAAPVAGLGLSRLVGPHFRHPQLGIMLYVLVMVFGVVQSHEEYGSFPDSRQMTAYLRTIVDHQGTYLVEEPEVPAYYLRDVTSWNQWQNTFALDYRGKDGKQYTGLDAYHAAVLDAHFDVIVLRGGITPNTDQAVENALKGNPHYRLTAVLPFTTSLGSSEFRIWVKQ